ncbi:hypothetical protein DJ64_12020 [Streptomyces griseorubens]|uniref:Uncharacterized protein n=1 Tax=Streptomyces griseorubens TaxID=66897 RepID=A0ABR4TA23_9ACTN|nr:hypothetical protein DJ64_12020 [Streptomyces griseorubens]
MGRPWHSTTCASRYGPNTGEAFSYAARKRASSPVSRSSSGRSGSSAQLTAISAAGRLSRGTSSSSASGSSSRAGAGAGDGAGGGAGAGASPPDARASTPLVSPSSISWASTRWSTGHISLL